MSRSLPGLPLNPDTPWLWHSDLELGGIWSSRPVFLIWSLKEETLLLLLALSSLSLDTSLQPSPQCLCPQIGCLPPHPDIWLWRAAQSGKALAERWEAGFLAQVPPPGFEPTFLFSPFSNSLFLRQDLAKGEFIYIMKTPVTEKWDLGLKWCVESRSPATLCEVLIGDTGASSLAPDHEHPTWELQQ